MADAPPSVLRVINASRELTPSETLLASEYYHLDRGHKGCYAREDIMARRVALGIRAMKTCRIRLKELGIISSAPAEGDRRRQTVYFTLPERYHPSERPKDDEVFQLAEMLDADIRSGRLQQCVAADQRVTEVLHSQKGERGRTQSAGEIAGKIVESVKPTAPINDEPVQSTALNPGELGAVSGKNGCSSTSEPVQFDAKLGAVSGTPIESVLNKDNKEQTRTDGSQSDLQQKNGSIEADPTTEPQTQSPVCPHPRGSPEWMSWQKQHLLQEPVTVA